MTIRQTYEIECNECGKMRIDSTHESEQEAWLSAASRGWTKHNRQFTPHQEHLCPGCSEAFNDG